MIIYPFCSWFLKKGTILQKYYKIITNIWLDKKILKKRYWWYKMKLYNKKILIFIISISDTLKWPSPKNIIAEEVISFQ